MKIKTWSGLVVLTLVLLAGCAAGPSTLAGTADASGQVAGFWLGLWHGVIAPVTFVLSLFAKDIGFYEVHNNGGWYNFGFLLGISTLHGGGHAGTRINRRGRR